MDKVSGRSTVFFEESFWIGVIGEVISVLKNSLRYGVYTGCWHHVVLMNKEE